MDVTFPPDLVASLRRHNGARGGAEVLRFSTHDRLVGVSETVGEPMFMPGIAEDLDEEEAEYYWHHWVRCSRSCRVSGWPRSRESSCADWRRKRV